MRLLGGSIFASNSESSIHLSISSLTRHQSPIIYHFGFECAVSSVVEHYLDTVGVTGSNPVSRTILPQPLQASHAKRGYCDAPFVSTDRLATDKVCNYFDDFSELGIVGCVTQTSASLALLDEQFWFCLKAQPKREHLAATALRRQFQVECFSPRLRFRKMTRRGPVWFVEAMFPGYLFAKFVYSQQHRAVESSHGIRGIVHFGDRLATLSENIVVALQSRVGAEEVVTVDSSIKIGQPVQITEGPFQGLEAVVTYLLPAKERIRVLLEFLGRSLETEISTANVLPARPSQR
jgi:transcriptional antiterminator RfaH